MKRPSGAGKIKHLLFFINSLKFGGAERVVANLSKALAESGCYRVTIVLLEGGIDYPISEKVRLMRLHYGRQNLFGKIFSLIFDPFILKDIVENYDIDIVLSFMQRPNVINMLSKTLGSRHSSCINVRVCLAKQYERIPLPFKWLGKVILRKLWRYADNTIVNSQVIKDEVIALFGTPPETVDVIYNPVNLNEIEEQSKEDVAEEWFTRKDTPIVINVARLTRQKGHIYLLKSIAKIALKRDVRLVIIGDGELRQTLMRQAERLGIEEKVLFMGWQANPYKYIARSDVFVLSSLWEGFPNVVLEAMACFCPVVVTDCLSGPSEILLPDINKKESVTETKYGMLVADTNVPNLSKAIEHLLKSEETGKRYAMAGFERAKHFALPVIVKDYEQIFVKNRGANG